MRYALGGSELYALQQVLATVDQRYGHQSAPAIRAIVQSCLTSGSITDVQRKKLLLLLAAPEIIKAEKEIENYSDSKPLKYNSCSDDDSAIITQRLHEDNESKRVFLQKAAYQRWILPAHAFPLYILPFAVAGFYHARTHYHLKGVIGSMTTQQGKDFRASLKANVNHKQAQQAAQAKAKKNTGGEQRERTRGGQGRSR